MIREAARHNLLTKAMPARRCHAQPIEYALLFESGQKWPGLAKFRQLVFYVLDQCVSRICSVFCAMSWPFLASFLFVAVWGWRQGLICWI